jgi:hypothetical protein
MNKLTRISATVASSAALVAGFTGLAGAAPLISDSGRDSNNQIEFRNRVDTDVSNRTTLNLRNNNPQDAHSGNSNVRNNDDVDGDVTTGSATNDSWVEATVNVDNTSSSSAALGGGGGGSSSFHVSDASIQDSGRNSNNQITASNHVDTDVRNTTTVNLTNNNRQTATSGNANVSNNDDVSGTVSTGDASNTSTAVFDVTVSN